MCASTCPLGAEVGYLLAAAMTLELYTPRPYAPASLGGPELVFTMGLIDVSYSRLYF